MKIINGKTIFTEPLTERSLLGKHDTTIYITKQAYLKTDLLILTNANHIRNIHFKIIKHEREILK